MNSHPRPLQIVVYQDVLCGWCYLLDARLAPLKTEFSVSASWRTRPYPLRPNDVVPTAKDVETNVEELRRAQKEPGGALLSPELWTAGDPPRSSVPALAALEAAKLQGSSAVELLSSAMKRAALEQGVNVTRSDVVYELAARVGLDMNRFSAAYQAPETRRLILEEHRLATDRGVRGVPCVVINGRWMISGLREPTEYREHILSCLRKVRMSQAGSSSSTLH
jgi:predicted DsbA family dithiol-disulfide isomerase